MRDLSAIVAEIDAKTAVITYAYRFFRRIPSARNFQTRIAMITVIAPITTFPKKKK